MNPFVKRSGYYVVRIDPSTAWTDGLLAGQRSLLHVAEVDGVIAGYALTTITQLLYTNPVLTGNRAAMMNTKLQDFAAELLGFFEFTLIIGIVEDKGMQVAVTRMEHVCYR